MLAKPHRSIPVNPLLANAMFLMGYVERAGTGTEDIIDKCRDWGLSAPVWEDDGDFKVVLYRQNVTANGRVNVTANGRVNVTANGRVNVSAGLSSTEKQILSVIGSDSLSNALSIARTLNVSERTVRRAFQSLQAKSLIRRVGADKNGHWEVSSLPKEYDNAH